MGRVHAEALRRLGTVECATVCGRDEARPSQGAGRSRPSNAVHICTPNAVHFPDGQGRARSGQARAVREASGGFERRGSGAGRISPTREKLRNCTCHNLRYYPMVQQMRRMREAGDLGEILVVQGTYSQDWLLYDTDWNWRIDPKRKRPVARHGGYRLALVRYGGARHRAAHHLAVRRFADVS